MPRITPARVTHYQGDIRGGQLSKAQEDQLLEALKPLGVAEVRHSLGWTYAVVPPEYGPAQTQKALAALARLVDSDFLAVSNEEGTIRQYRGSVSEFAVDEVKPRRADLEQMLTARFPGVTGLGWLVSHDIKKASSLKVKVGQQFDPRQCDDLASAVQLAFRNCHVVIERQSDGEGFSAQKLPGEERNYPHEERRSQDSFSTPAEPNPGIRPPTPPAP
ncbi:MAG: hypothetical protein ACYC8T_07910 [Myxococcaceae bacterium]